MRLIITEKNNAAVKIASILSKGGKPKEQAYLKVPYFLFTDAQGLENMAVGLKGHVLQIEFPPEYADWRKVDPRDLIDAPLQKGETAKAVVRAVKKLAKEADSLVIATDFDREGELIGLEAQNIATEENEHLIRTVRRARFSALTAGEIERAFGALEYLSEPLAHAGEARQDIDLIWGATLTRFVSLATSRLGNQFLSVGRVQTPTLALIAAREKERRAFVPEPYWVVRVDLTAKGQSFQATHKTERFLDEALAQAVFDKLTGPATVTQLKRTTKKVTRPAPFSTTSFTSAATSLGYSASAVMRIAEDLYMGGYISYPRTDNTVYPSSLDLREVLDTLAQSEFGREVQELLAKPALTPSRGDKRTTDHPPIYPTGVARRGVLGDREWKLYELVVRRFMATLANDAVSESNRIDLEMDAEPFFLRGSRVLEPGWLAYYPYSRAKDAELPALDEGDLADMVQKYFDSKETQPPGRYGQGPLIELMEKLGLGTKATRHNIIQNLYDRGYIHGNPVEPTEMGIKVAEALLEYAPRIATPEMTAHLEADMDAISEGDRSKDEVVGVSRDLLREAYQSLADNREAVAARIFEGITDDKILGDCPKCQTHRLRIIRSKASKKRFVGCEGYPDCDQTYPLPQRGDIISMNESCPQCGTPRIKILTGRGRPWVLCIDPDCPTKAEYKAKVAARAAAIAAKEAAGEDVTPAKKTTSAGRAAAAKKTTTARKTTATKTTAAKKPAAPKKPTVAKTTTGKPAAVKKPAATKRAPARKAPAAAAATDVAAVAVADTVPAS